MLCTLFDCSQSSPKLVRIPVRFAFWLHFRHPQCGAGCTTYDKRLVWLGKDRRAWTRRRVVQFWVFHGLRNKRTKLEEFAIWGMRKQWLLSSYVRILKLIMLQKRALDG